MPLRRSGLWELAEAGVSGEPVVVEELTSETQLVRALPSGALQAEVSPVPVRVRTGGGSWAGVDTTRYLAEERASWNDSERG